MTDIVKRLREHTATSSYLTECRPRGLICEAADEIERLRHDLTLARLDRDHARAERVVAWREGIEAALATAGSVVSPCDDMQRHVAADEITAAIRELLEESEQ